MESTHIKQQFLGGTEELRRFWLQGQELADFQWEPGRRYDRVIRRGEIVIEANPTGRYVISRKGKSGRSAEIPVLDIQSGELTQMFESCHAVHIEVNDHSITVRQSDLDHRIQEREKAFIDALSAGRPLKAGSAFHGGGILDAGLHEGLEQSGVAAAVSMAIELESEYLNASRRNNRFWARDALTANSPIELLMMGTAADRKLDIVTAGIPCTGASKAGRSKLSLKHAEAHEKAGAMFLYTLQWIAKANPALVVFENVIEYANTSSWSVIRAFMTTMGYNLSYREVTGSEFGAFEDRKRMIAVAVSRGLDDRVLFDIDQVTPRRTKPAFLEDVLDEEGTDEKAWKNPDYFLAKAIRDKQAGKGFTTQFLDPKSATKVRTIGRGYAKYRSTEPMVLHPNGHGRFRLLSATEHARAKTVPERLIDGLPTTRAHEVLGQSVIYEWFHQLGAYIGGWASELLQTTRQPVAQQLELIH